MFQTNIHIKGVIIDEENIQDVLTLKLLKEIISYECYIYFNIYGILSYF